MKDTKELTEMLEKKVVELFASDEYMRYLTKMSRFHNYSVNNSLLIAMQCPDATLVAGFTTWKTKFHRYVKKGEKGIVIFVPMQVKDKNDDEKKFTIFRPAYVFDVSQTDGDPLPTFGPSELFGDVSGYRGLILALTNLSPVGVSYKNIEGSSKGYFNRDTEEIVVRSGMSEVQTVKTLAHEIAHAILHNRNMETKSRSTMEVEAESVAYVVCSYFGIDTSEYSFTYVTLWSANRGVSELRKSLETIQTTADEMINKIETFNKENALASSDNRLKISSGALTYINEDKRSKSKINLS